MDLDFWRYGEELEGNISTLYKEEANKANAGGLSRDSSSGHMTLHMTKIAESICQH